MTTDLLFRKTTNPQLNIFVVKPDGVRRGLCPQIEDDLRQKGFRILARKKKLLNAGEVREFYLSSFRRDFPSGEWDIRTEPHVDAYTSGEMFAYLVQRPGTSGQQLYDLCKLVRGDN